MVTKSLLDKILSKTVKRKELNALSVSKEDRDRIYNNIINGGSGSSNNTLDLYDVYDIVVVGYKSGQFKIVSKGNNSVSAYYFLNNMEQSYALIDLDGGNINIDFDKNVVTFNQTSDYMYFTKIVKSSAKPVNSDIFSYSRYCLLVIPKNLKKVVSSSNSPTIIYDSTDELSKINKSDNIMLNPTIDKMYLKELLIKAIYNPN